MFFGTFRSQPFTNVKSSMYERSNAIDPVSTGRRKARSNRRRRIASSTHVAEFRQIHAPRPGAVALMATRPSTSTAQR
jgi:hypothetical protein